MKRRSILCHIGSEDRVYAPKLLEDVFAFPPSPGLAAAFCLFLSSLGYHILWQINSSSFRMTVGVISTPEPWQCLIKFIILLTYSIRMSSPVTTILPSVD